VWQQGCSSQTSRHRPCTDASFPSGRTHRDAGPGPPAKAMFRAREHGHQHPRRCRVGLRIHGANIGLAPGFPSPPRERSRGFLHIGLGVRACLPYPPHPNTIATGTPTFPAPMPRWWLTGPFEPVGMASTRLRRIQVGGSCLPFPHARVSTSTRVFGCERDDLLSRSIAKGTIAARAVTPARSYHPCRAIIHDSLSGPGWIGRRMSPGFGTGAFQSLTPVSKCHPFLLEGSFAFLFLPPPRESLPGWLPNRPCGTTHTRARGPSTSRETGSAGYRAGPCLGTSRLPPKRRARRRSRIGEGNATFLQPVADEPVTAGFRRFPNRHRAF
jgi:hypothetical protein